MELLYALENIRCPLLDAVMGAVTELGGETVYMAVAIIAFWCVGKGLGYYILSVGFAGTVLNQFLKITCRVPRPWVQDPEFTIVESAREAATGYSFPSGHTQNAFASFGCIGMWSRRRVWRVVCAVIIVLIALSRMYLGVHTPLDVGVAFALGLVLTGALWPVFRDIEEHPGRMYAALAVLIALTAAYIAYTELFPFPADIVASRLKRFQHSPAGIYHRLFRHLLSINLRSHQRRESNCFQIFLMGCITCCQQIKPDIVDTVPSYSKIVLAMHGDRRSLRGICSHFQSQGISTLGIAAHFPQTRVCIVGDT